MSTVIQTADRVLNIAPSGIRKINEKALAMERAGIPVLHFEIGRPDFDTPEYIKQAARESLDRGEVFYTSNFGDQDLREAIAWKLRTQNQIPAEAGNILVATGLSEAIFSLLCTILNPGDEILVPDPVWMNYINVPNLLGAVPVPYRLREENGFQPDPEEIRRLAGPRTRAMVIVTPNNPTGSVIGRETLEQLAAVAVEKNLVVLADEVYERLLYEGAEHVSIASLPGMMERTFTLNGFSKAYSMTGWRLGYVCAPVDILAQVNKVHQHNVTCATSFAQKAAIIALREEGDEVLEMVKEYQRRRDTALSILETIPGISCHKPDGAFYLFLNIGKLGVPCETFCEKLLDEKHIALVPGTVFGAGGEGYARMSFANSLENVAEGCRRIKEAVDEKAW